MEELEVIVQRMIDANEPEDNIAKVIKEYNSKKENDSQTMSAAAESKTAALDTGSPSVPTFSELLEQAKDASKKYDNTRHEWMLDKNNKGEVVDYSFFNKSEKDAVTALSLAYDNFKFEEAGNLFDGEKYFNMVKVTAPNGKKSEAIEFRVYDAADPKDAARRRKESFEQLTSFINENSGDKERQDQDAKTQKDIDEYINYSRTVESGIDKEAIIKEYSGDIFAPKTTVQYVPTSKIGGRVQKLEKVEQPYIKELQLAAKELGPNAPKFEIEARAREILINNAIASQRDRVSEELIEDSKEYKSLLEKGAKQFAEKYGAKVELNNSLLNDFENGDDIKKLREIDGKLSNTKYQFEIEEGEQTLTLEDGRIIPASILDEYNKANISLNAKISHINSLQDEINSNIDIIPSTNQQLDLLKRNYDGIQKFFVTTGVGTAQLLDGASYGLKAFTGANSLEDDKKFIERQNRYQEIRQEFEKDVQFDDAFNSVENFFTFTAQELANQLPIFAALTTPVGFGIIGASGFGEQYSKMTSEQLDPFVRADYSEMDKKLSSIGYAGAEVIFGALPTARLVRGATKSLTTTAARNELYKNQFKDFYKTKKLEGIIGAGNESLGEGLTIVTQNIINGVDPFENVDHAMFSGALFGTGFASVPLIKGAIVQKFSDFDTYQSVMDKKKQQKELHALNNRIEDQLQRGIVSVGTRDDIERNEKLINELEEDIISEINEVETKITKTYNGVAREFVEAVSLQQDLRVEYDRIKNSDLEANAKEQSLKLIELQFNSLQSGINKFKKSKTFDNAWALYSGKRKNKDEVKRIKEQAEEELKATGKQYSDTQIEDKARLIYNTEQIKKDISKSKSKYNKLNKSLKDFETKEQAVEYINEVYDNRIKAEPDREAELNNNRNSDIQAIQEGSHGFNIKTVDGRRSVVVINSMAADDRLETRTHELKHQVFTNILGNNPEVYNDLAEQVLAWTNKYAKDSFDRITAFAERDAQGNLISYEVMAVFFEEVAANKINLNKANRFSGVLGYLIGKGANDVGLEIDLAGEEDAVKFLTGVAQKIKQGTLTVADVSKIKKNVLISEVTNIVRDEKTALSRAASDKVQEIYDRQGDSGMFEIFEQFKPITTRIARRFRDVPGYDEQLIIDEIETGERGILDLIRAYKPESGVPLAAYINKFLPARSIEAGNRILKTEFEDDVTEAKGVVADEAPTVEVEERKTKAKVIADELNIADKVALEVSKAGLDVTKLKNFKSVPNAVRDAVGEMLGISPTKIKTKANLTADEVASAQRWFNKNKQLVIDALPQGFDVEGEATGVPRTVLAALYTKRETRAKTKAGLKGQVKRTNIKDSEFLELIDIIDGKPTRNRNTSARIIALADLLGKTITNQEIRRTTPGVERIRSGMSETMFSASNSLIQVNPEFEGDLKNINKLLNTFIKDGTFKHSTKEEIDSFYIEVENVWAKNLPKDLITKTVLRPSNRILPGKGRGIIEVEGVEMTIDQYYTQKRDDFLAREDVKYGKPFTGDGANYKYGRTYGSMFGITPQAINAANSNGTIAKINKENLSMHRQLWQRVNQSIRDNSNNAKAWGNYFSLVAQDVTHPHRMGAEMIGWTMKPKGHKGKLYEWEHAMPATRAYLYLLEASLSENIDFNSAYDLVIDNFKLIALDKADDMKLKGAGRQTSMGKNWTVFDNWYDRYFDPEVFKQGGINPQGIKGLDGRTFDQIYNINAEGNSIFSKTGIKKNMILSEATSNSRAVLNYTGKSRGMSTFDFDETLIIDGENFVTARKGVKSKVKRVKDDFKGSLSTKQKLNWKTDDIGYMTTNFKISGNNYKITLYPTDLDDTNYELEFDLVTEQGLTQEMTGTGNQFKVLGTVYNGLLDVIKQKPNIETIGFSALTKDKSRVKVYNILTNRLGAQLGWDTDIYEYSGGTQLDFEIAKPVKIPSDKWPIDGPRYAEQGYEFDFSDFVNVRGGKEGPLLQKMKNQIKKYGPNNVFVLTARMQEAAEPIHKWLKSQGINIPFENITGLGDSRGDAKAEWMLEKYAEGYNDMYFVDDALPNVEAVQYVFNQLDVKGKSIQAKTNFSKSLSKGFNQMLQRTKGVGAEKVFSRVAAQKRGKNVGKYRFFVPPSADDFAGLLYYFYGKGKQGDADMQFMKKALLDPFARADREMSMARMAILDDYKELRKQFPEVKKKLGKLINKDSGFTFDNAIRVYLFNKAGYDIPGLSKRDIQFLDNVVKTDQDLRSFADLLGLVSKRKEGYIEPTDNWSVENIASDMQNIVDKIGRKQFLAEFIENKNIIFSPENMNKIEAIYGSQFRQALEDVLFRMENGTNRSANKSYGQAWTNWVNGSVGAIMFFNSRSAVLQTLSTVNFINFQDNNIFAAGKALANQKQYWSDFSTLFNSDFLRARRAGLQINVNEAELASAVAGAQNKAKAALRYLLKIGFTPTQIADSFAIASGGSTFYRNRINTYLKQGMAQKTAEEKAFLDFQEIAQETQQSSRPDRISQQQASPLGRLILAFANTPLQYNRLIKKAYLDLANRRGDWRSNVSRILYYGAIQNVIFSAMQSAIFALSFDDEEDDELDRRTLRIVNGMTDTILRGSGVTGAAIATIKNVIMEFAEQSKRESRADYGQVVVEALQVSPPMGSKARKLYSALNTYKFDREIMASMDTFDYNNPIWDAIGNVTSAATNLPLDRGFRKIDNIREALNQDNSAMQRAFLFLGWSSFDLQVGERVVMNKGKKNEYVKYLDTKRQAQQEAEDKLKKEKKQARKSKQCTARSRNTGRRCQNTTTNKSGRCYVHN